MSADKPDREDWVVLEAEEPPRQKTLVEQMKAKTPIFTLPVSKLDEKHSAETPVAIITNAGKRISTLNRPLFNDPERDDPEMEETFSKLDELIKRNASGQEIFDEVSVLMSKSDMDKALRIWGITIIYLQEIVEQAFKGMESRLKNKYSEQEIISALQYCWQRVASNEGKLFILENTRALIQKSGEKEKTKIFWGLVISIINSLKTDDEEPGINLPAKIRAKFPHSEIAERVQVTKLLDIDESHTQIKEQVEEKLITAPRNDRVVLFKIYELLEKNLFSDIEKMMDHTNTEDYMKMCIELHRNSIKEIEKMCEIIEEGTIVVSDHTVELYEKAWDDVILPRLLIWEEILHSDLLLPEDKAVT